MKGVLSVTLHIKRKITTDLGLYEQYYIGDKNFKILKAKILIMRKSVKRVRLLDIHCLDDSRHILSDPSDLYSIVDNYDNCQ